MAETIYYVKEGKKYVPVSYYDSDMMSALPAGATLIVKEDGCTMYRRKVDINSASFLAAAVSLEHDIGMALVRASEARPHRKELTQEQHDDWDAFMKKHGESFRWIEYPSGQEVAAHMLSTLQKRLEAAHENPAVKEAWDHYRMMVGLTLKEENTK